MNNKSRKHTEEMKHHLSLKRKEWLKNNKDKHNWNYNKNKSIPCEIIKKHLSDVNVVFVYEYIPFKDRFYSIDIAFPEKKIGIEINGNQHYDKIGKLQKYYQERHDFFENRGWKIYEFHFSSVYNGDVFNNILKILDKSPVICNFDYDFWINNPKTKYEKHKKQREEKNNLKIIKIEIIKENLIKSSINFSKIGWVGDASKIIGCSHQKVNKWMKKYMTDFYNNCCYKRKTVVESLSGH